MLKINYPVSLFSITQTSKERVAVEKALIFDYSGCKLQENSWKSLGLLKKSCDCHVLKVYNVWLPYEENKMMHFESEASVLDSRRSGICIHFSGQKMRIHCSLWVISWSVKKKKKSYPALNCLASFLLEPVSWKLPSWKDFRKHIFNTCALHSLLLNGVNVFSCKIQRQRILAAGVTWKCTGFLPSLGMAFLHLCSKFHCQMPHLLYPLAAPACRWKYRTKISLNCSAEQFWAMASKGKKYFTRCF